MTPEEHRHKMHSDILKMDNTSKEFLLYLDKEAEWNLHLYKSHSLDPIAKARYDLLTEIKSKYLFLNKQP